MTRFIPATVVLGAIVFAAPITLSSAPPTAAARAMSDAAASFLKDLTAEQRSKATFKFEDDTRFEFRFTPRTGLRTGMPLKEMSEAQRAKAHALLKTGLSVRGYTTATTIIELETVLRAIEPARTGANAIVRDPELYFVSIYGDPAGKSPWGWKFEGHHISVNFTVVDDKPVVFSPSFFGSNPAVVKEGPKQGTRALREEEEAGRALDGGLQRCRTREGHLRRHRATRDDHGRESRSQAARSGSDRLQCDVAGTTAPARKADGRLPWSRLTRAGQGASGRGAEGRDGQDHVRLGGRDGRRRTALLPVQGPTFLIEYDNTQNDANHIHSVWRDFNGDFGRDLLREHYKTVAHRRRRRSRRRGPAFVPDQPRSLRSRGRRSLRSAEGHPRSGPPPDGRPSESRSPEAFREAALRAKRGRLFPRHSQGGAIVVGLNWSRAERIRRELHERDREVIVSHGCHRSRMQLVLARSARGRHSHAHNRVPALDTHHIRRAARITGHAIEANGRRRVLDKGRVARREHELGVQGNRRACRRIRNTPSLKADRATKQAAAYQPFDHNACRKAAPSERRASLTAFARKASAHTRLDSRFAAKGQPSRERSERAFG